MKYDVAVIGGGPAGMMSAIRAGANGARVVLLEKNNRPGIKLLITGGGRCNITNVSDEPIAMSKKYGNNGKFLLSSLTRFSPEDAICFFEEEGIKTKTEERGRVFPASNISRDVLNSLLGCLEKHGVEIKFGSQVASLESEGKKITKARLSDGGEISAEKFILATGGKSYPMTGSTGDGFKWLEALGHSIIDLMPGLCAVRVKENFIAGLQGVSLKDASVEAYKDGKILASVRGEAIFTGEGMSGPAVHDISKLVSANMPGAWLKLGFFPDEDSSSLDNKIQKQLSEGSNKMLKNVLAMLLPERLSSAILRLADVDGEKISNIVTREERKKILDVLGDFKLEIVGTAGFDKANITSGGVNLKEVDPKTMKSKLIDNLYFAGEILDLDGPTGGYNLQVCWSTGFVAGESASKK